MRPSKELLALLLLALLALSGCTVPGLGDLSSFLPQPKEPDYCANFLSKDDCYLQFAQENQAPDFCKKIADSVKSEQCLFGLALSAKNQAPCKIYSANPSKCVHDLALALSQPDLCVEVEDEKLSDQCYTALGAKLSDPNVCLLAKTQESKGNCLYTVAQKTSSAQTCTNIFDEGQRHKCLFTLSVTLSDPELCAKFDALFSANDCWQGFAVLKKDALLCGRVTEEAARDQCQLDVGTVSGETLELKGRLAGLCGKVQDEALAARCKQRLSTYEVGKDFCDDFQEQGTLVECLDQITGFFADSALCPKYRTRELIDNCFEAVALKTSSLQGCKLIVEQTKELSCIYKLAVKEKNPKYCAETHVTDSFDYRNECYREVAVLSQNPEACDPIYFREKRAACRAELAVLKQDYSLCKEIPNEPLSDSNDPFFTRDHCFKAVVETIRDKSLCDFIQDSTRKEACRALS